jgi:glucose/arabinose dehydrogenase
VSETESYLKNIQHLRREKVYSGIVSPDPPSALGKSCNFGRPSLIGTQSQWGAGISGTATEMAFAPDGRLFVCLQDGHLRVIDKTGVLLTSPFVILSVDSNDDRGLLGVAFDLNFASTVPGSPAHNRVSRFTVNGNVAVANGEFVVVDLDSLSSAENHNGGAIHNPHQLTIE